MIDVAAAERGVRVAMAQVIRDVRRTGPVTETHWCESCHDEHTETDYAPMYEAVNRCFSGINALALAKRDGARLSPKGEHVVALARLHYGDSVAMTTAEVYADINRLFREMAEVLKATPPTPPAPPAAP